MLENIIIYKIILLYNIFVIDIIIDVNYLFYGVLKWFIVGIEPVVVCNWNYIKFYSFI